MIELSETNGIHRPESNPAASAAADSGLNAVVEAWPELPDAVRTGIVAIVAATWQAK